MAIARWGQRHRTARSRYPLRFHPVLEPLEERVLLAADPANVFASFNGLISQAGEEDTIRIHLTPENFTIDSAHATLGFVLSSTDGGGLVPNVVEIDSLDPGNVPTIEESVGLAGGSSLVLGKLKHGDYDVHISAADSTTGAWQLQIFLAGDVNGDFVVDATDHGLLNDVVNGMIVDPDFLAEGDADRDGQITGYDLARAASNMGVSTSVRVLTVTVGLDPASDTGVLGDNLVNQTPVNVIGTTLEGAEVRLDEDGDGFDDGTTIATPLMDTTNYSLSADLVPGPSTLSVEARESFGQSAQAETTVTLDVTPPTVTSTSPAEGEEVDAQPGVNIPVEVVFSESMIGTTVLAGLSLSGNDNPSITPLNPLFDEATNTLSFELSASLTDSDVSVTIADSATDLAGNGLDGGPFALNFSVNRLTTITEVSPADGEEMVSLTREAIIRFSSQIDPTTITPASLQVIALGEPVSGRRVVSSTERFVTFFPDQPWNASTEVRIEINGDLVIDRRGRALDADDDRIPGGSLTADFTTLPITRIPGTNVFGFVFDSFSQQPIVGATIRVDAFPEANAVTDANGRFELVDMPAPQFFVHVDGSTATGVPAGFVYPNVGKPFHSVPGQTVQIEMDREPFDIFLPPMALGDVQPLSPTEPTDVGFGNAGIAELANMFPGVDPSVFDLMQVTFAPGAAVDDFGNAATEAAIIPVPPDRIPAPLPPNLNPQLVVSIQAGGATNFDVPAPITFPNLEGLAPGEKSLIFSFDHDAGEWKVVGTGTVSEDGSVVVSDPGVGILAPGWHFVISGTRSRFSIGQRGGCASGSDFLHDDFPVFTPTLLEQSLLFFRRMNSDATLESEFRFYLTRLGTGSIGQSMVTRFMSGSQTTFTHGSGSTLSSLTLAGDTFMGVRQSVENTIENQIQAQANTGVIDNRQLLVSIPGISFSFLADGSTLKSLIGGTQGAELFIENFDATATIISPEVGGFGSYSANLRFVICDDFGVDRSDIYFPPLAAFWILQHERIGPAPFVNEIIVEVPISGTFTVPPGFEDVEIIISNLSVNITAESGSTAAGFGTDPLVFYRYVMENGVELSGTVDPDTPPPNFVLTPDLFFTATFYQPSTNRSAQVAGTTSPSGQPTLFTNAPGGQDENDSVVNLDTFGGTDADGDGIPDVGEFAIGTDPENTDTDNDGISDSAELDQGLNPLDDVGLPTGEVSNLTLPGTTEAVAVEGDAVYVATGSHGLAIVDASRLGNPILQGQIDLPGTATGVAVDSSLQIAAVATGSSLQLVDVSDPMMPVVNESVTTGASRVVVFDGLAYATAGTTLNVVDLLTGDLVQTLPLPGSGNVTGLAREGTTLYAFVSGSDTFSVIDIFEEASAAVLGQTSVSVASSNVGVFVGNGVAWLAGSGLRTVGVSDPISPSLIHGADAFFTARRVALNGSGLGLLAPDGNSFVEVYDVTNTSDTDNRLLQFPLSSGARDVAISRGIAYIGTSAGLSVVNYRPFDGEGQPPTVEISTPLVDQDPGTPGVQVNEGGSIPIRVEVTDDVQVRNVDLLVDGEVIATDVSFPFDFVAPAISSEGTSSISVQVRAIDTGGNSALSAPLFFEVVPDTFPPTVISVDPADSTTTFEGRERVQLRFSESLDVASASGTNFSIIEAGPNGTLGDADDVSIPITSVQLRSDDTIIQLTTDPLGVGTYQLRVDEPGITDRAGNALGTGEFLSGFTVAEFVTSPDFLPFGTTISFTDDSTRNAGPLPFEFAFFGAPVAGDMLIRSNGTIEFGTSGVQGVHPWDNFGLPRSPITVVAPYFDDVNPGAGGQIGVFNGDGVRAVTWLGVPYFGRTGTVTFQVAFHANGVIETRYGDLATPPGGTADSGISVGTATIGLASGSVGAIPSIGNIANKPDIGITRADGILDASGLALLDELPGNDILVFTPDGAGGYIITHNAAAGPGLTASGTTTDPTGSQNVDLDLETLSASAMAMWMDALNSSDLPAMTFRIADLPTNLLGTAQSMPAENGKPSVGLITIDVDASGMGWFVDPTPQDNAEFATEQTAWAFEAGPGSAASGDFDLLTVLLHEIGHVAGFTDSNSDFASHVVRTVDGQTLFVGEGFSATLTPDADHLNSSVHPWDLMNATLEPSVRKLPSLLDAQMLTAAYDASSAATAGVTAALHATSEPLVQPTVPERPAIRSIAGLLPAELLRPWAAFWSAARVDTGRDNFRTTIAQTGERAIGDRQLLRQTAGDVLFAERRFSQSLLGATLLSPLADRREEVAEGLLMEIVDEVFESDLLDPVLESLLDVLSQDAGFYLGIIDMA